MDDLVDCHICSLLAQILCSICHSFPWTRCPTLQQTIRPVPLHIIIIIIMISSIIACALFPTVHRLEPHGRVATANLRNTVTTQMRVWVRACRACVYLMVTSCSQHNRHIDTASPDAKYIRIRWCSMTDAIMKLLINKRVIGEQLMSSLRFIFICSIRIVSQLSRWGTFALRSATIFAAMPRCRRDRLLFDGWMPYDCQMIVCNDSTSVWP